MVEESFINNMLRQQESERSRKDTTTIWYLQECRIYDVFFPMCVLLFTEKNRNNHSSKLSCADIRKY